MVIQFRCSYFFPLVVVALISSCASSDRLSQMKRDPFADPARFESLASNAYTMPVPVIPKLEPALVAAPSELSAPSSAKAPASFDSSAPVASTRLRLLDSSSLVSNPDIPVMNPESVRREVAGTPALGVGTVAAVPIGTSVPVTEVRTPDSAFLALVRGNERFVLGAVKGENRGEARRRALASSQNPSTVVLSSSDSRVPPELVFDQGLGDLSVVRVAGGVLGSAQVAAIEHAIKHFDAKLIVVMGHEGSDAVKAAVEGKGKKRGSSGESTDEQWLISSIQSNLHSRGLASVGEPDPQYRKPVMANVDAISDQLLLRSKVVSEAVASGKIKIVRGIYGIETGKVDFWGLK